MEGMYKDFDELYERYHLLVYKIAYVFTRNAHDSEDITQELFVKLCFGTPVFKTEQHEKAWIIKVTENLAKNHLKKAYKRREVSVEDMSGNFVDDTKTDAFEAIAALPEKYKTAIILYYYFGYSVSEIGRITKQSESNVKARLMRARQMLKLELEE